MQGRHGYRRNHTRHGSQICSKFSLEAALYHSHKCLIIPLHVTMALSLYSRRGMSAKLQVMPKPDRAIEMGGSYDLQRLQS